MASITETPPAAIREELTRLRRQLGRDIPKKTDRNLLIATWNLREFGDLTRKWDSTQADTPKRDLHALACIKEIVKRFDVVAIQEAQKSLGALRELLVGLGRNWTVILTDPVEDDKGDDERLAFVFDRSRLAVDGLACELVVPYSWSKAKRPKTGIAAHRPRSPVRPHPLRGQLQAPLGDLHPGHPPHLLGEQVRPGRQGACEGAELDRRLAQGLGA